MKKDLDPAEVAAEMLRGELPGFEALIDTARDAIAIRGGLPIKATLSSDIVYHMVPRPPVFDTVFRDFREVFAPEDDRAREARLSIQRKALELEVAPAVAHMADEIRRLAIAAVGLEKVIEAREDAAFARGRRSGFDAGRERGRREGRAELLREWQDAAATLRGMLNEMPEDGDE